MPVSQSIRTGWLLFFLVVIFVIVVEEEFVVIVLAEKVVHIRLVVIFIVVLVVAWSHLGASGRVHDEAKERARIAQQELDTAQSTLDDINRQIEEAQK